MVVVPGGDSANTGPSAPKADAGTRAFVPHISDDTPPDGWPTPQAAYVHVPFCRHRCGYCNFSIVSGRDDLIGDFIRSVDLESSALGRPAVETVFIGGGTPTHLPAPQLALLLETIRRRFEFGNDAEFSVEANPEDINAEKLQVLCDHGVNRISLGVQSFDTRKLTVLERGHSGEAAKQAIRQAAESIPNISIDLIFGAPAETAKSWRCDLVSALNLPIKHLSTYALTFEKGTSFWTRQMHGALEGVCEDTEVEMYTAARELTQLHDWSQYEVSNFSVPGFRCQHNVAYWNGRGWYAVGPGAAAFADGQRTVNHRSPRTYLKRVLSGESPVVDRELISLEQYARERAAFGIRMIDGINLGDLSNETGFDLHAVAGQFVDRFVEQGVLTRAGDHLALTHAGVLFADSVATEFLG